MEQVIEASKFSWGYDMAAYLCYMAVRLLEMHRVLKNTGSVYLHCDPTASHYLKLLMDAVFGKENFQNEIIWSYRTGGSSKFYFARKHDIILFYAGENRTFNTLKEKAYTKAKNRQPGIVNYGTGNAEFFRDRNGVYNLVNMRDVWDISYITSTSKERTGYPTQKPLELYRRIIEASTNVGDMVLDPFCGCATTLVAAEQLERNWIGMDIWSHAHDLVIERLKDEYLAGPDGDRGARLALKSAQITYQTEAPDRTDISATDANIPPFYLSQKRTPEPWEKLTHRQMTEMLAEAQQNGEGVTCAGCGRSMEREFMELDHINPKSTHGPNHIENRILLCRPCNKTKRDHYTLPGLQRENTKIGWMRNPEKATNAQNRAWQRAQKAKDGQC